MLKSICVAAIFMLLLVVPEAFPQTGCSPAPLSQDDARNLVRLIPDALAAQRIGGKLTVIDWKPGHDYREDVFFFFELLSTKSLPTTPLDNGVLGYFGVNRTTGEVVQLDSDTWIKGATLKRLQDKLRASHCISADLVRKNRCLSLER